MSFCNSGGRKYLSLCEIPVSMSRDGHAGDHAHMYLPFYGHYFFSGARYTFPNSTIPQDRSRYIGGRTFPKLEFSKNDCTPSSC